MIRVKNKGNFKKTTKFLVRSSNLNIISILNKYGAEGVLALSEATPKDTGLTASSWKYEVEKVRGGYRLYWTNSNVIDGTNIAVILQYGHANINGSYVEGVDYINPALKKALDDIANAAWREVTRI